jgi:hypothetical protein
MTAFKERRLKGTTTLKNLKLKTPRGTIRLVVYTEADSQQNKRDPNSGEVPVEIDLTLRSFLGVTNDPFTKERTCCASWSEEPHEPGFYVRWKPGDGLSEVYYGGTDDPATFIDTTGAKFFGPFQLPI